MKRLIHIAAILVGLAGGSAHAADWYTGAPASGVAAPPAAFGVAIDSAVTVDTKDSRYATLIGTIAPFTNFDQSGARLRLGGVLGQYAYISGTAGLGRVKGTQEDGSFLVGYEWVSRRLTLAAYVGGNISNNRLDKYDPLNTAAGTAYGAKVAVDFNYRPADWLMLSGVASYSTAHDSYYVRLKGGYAFLADLFVGPEAIFLGDSFFRQWRVGGHVTGARIGPLQFGASAGMLDDKVRGRGVYGIFDARLAF